MLTRSILPLCFVLLAACSQKSESSPTPPSSITLPGAMKLDAAPPSAQNVIEARATAADGAEVVVTGRVRDFHETRAVFTVADLSLQSCADGGEAMDDCKTPWDYCCVDPRTLAQGTATIELHNGEELAMGSAQGWNGLDHLKQVVVRGKARKGAEGNLTLIASGVFVQP